MKTAIIIAEYNPFHNGHAYQIDVIRRLGFNRVVVVMSGNFVQRGSPAITDKAFRARAALACGADLVVELPLPYAMATAERFAFGGISLANAFEDADATLFFGSESNKMADLKRIVSLICSDAVDMEIKQLVISGKSYAHARQLAVFHAGGNAELLCNPNDILAVEYLKHIHLTGNLIAASALPRVEVNHDAISPGSGFASASYLRARCAEKGLPALKTYVPDAAFNIYREACEQNEFPCSEKKLETAILARLRSMSAEDFAVLPDMSEGLPNRLYNTARSALSLDEFIASATTKRYPSARIRRAAMSAFLGVPSVLCRKAPPYMRVLGMTTNGEQLVRIASRNIPVIASLLSADEEYAAVEAHSTDLFELCKPQPNVCGEEYRRRVIKI
ncbi:MAG: nucleotidyltransferase family protein [Oscillospiraceae bacterium]|nr:nucleotidyltransferase family protein [Oscillospiraceae bacterium]